MGIPMSLRRLPKPTNWRRRWAIICRLRSTKIVNVAVAADAVRTEHSTAPPMLYVLPSMSTAMWRLKEGVSYRPVSWRFLFFVIFCDRQRSSPFIPYSPCCPIYSLAVKWKSAVTFLCWSHSQIYIETLFSHFVICSFCVLFQSICNLEVFCPSTYVLWRWSPLCFSFFLWTRSLWPLPSIHFVADICCFILCSVSMFILFFCVLRHRNIDLVVNVDGRSGWSVLLCSQSEAEP